jgi:UDP-2-acetamido-2-deoxy-ribo-hexuluronate aminotransferase
VSETTAAQRGAVKESSSSLSAHPVPFFTQAASFEARWPSIARHLEDVIDNGKYSHGRKVTEFEQAMAAYTGARHAIAVNSGTDALVIALRAAGLRPGDGVVVPAFSFVATASSVALARCRPRFADIDPISYSIAPDSAEAAVDSGTRAIMPVHLFCQLANMAKVLELAERRDLTVIEDSAEAIGMRWDGRHAGLLGRAGVLSFFPTKTLGAIGDAGMILTDDDALAELASVLRHHGRLGKTIDNIAGISYLSGISGTNSKMDDIQAAVLMAKLAHLDQDIARRADLAQLYSERLDGMPGVLRLPEVVKRDVETNSVFYVYLIEVENRNGLVEWLTAHGVGTETYYPVPLHLQPCFAELGHRKGDFPVAEAACERTVALPFHPDLSIADIDCVCDVIRAFYTGSRT